MWNFMYDTTVRDLAAVAGAFGLAGLPEPRIEPEIVLGLSRRPGPSMSEAELLGCVDWVAHGFEIVQSVYPGWKLSGAEAAAAFGLHGALMVGPRHAIGGDRVGWGERLEALTITLSRDGAAVADGAGRDVLGGPIRALRFLVEEIARYPGSAPIAAGEIVTTGTLTDAQPVRPGETWSTALRGTAIEGIRLQFA
jgi:2-oxo-3-hexenedioate decarboxylase